MGGKLKGGSGKKPFPLTAGWRRRFYLAHLERKRDKNVGTTLSTLSRGTKGVVLTLMRGEEEGETRHHGGKGEGGRVITLEYFFKYRRGTGGKVVYFGKVGEGKKRGGNRGCVVLLLSEQL